MLLFCLATVAKATAVGSIPACIGLVGFGGQGRIGFVFLVMSPIFVVVMTAWEIACEWYWPAEPAGPVPNGPTGVLSQTEAAERLDDLIVDLWEKDRWGS